MTDTPSSTDIDIEDVKVYATGVSLGMLGLSLLGHWGQSWAPVFAGAVFTVLMAAMLFAIVKIMNFLDPKVL